MNSVTLRKFPPGTRIRAVEVFEYPDYRDVILIWSAPKGREKGMIEARLDTDKDPEWLSVCRHSSIWGFSVDTALDANSRIVNPSTITITSDHPNWDWEISWGTSDASFEGNSISWT